VDVDRDLRRTKLVPSWLVGERTAFDAEVFMRDLASRLTIRVQLTTDGHRAYFNAVDTAFGSAIDYAVLHKITHPPSYQTMSAATVPPSAPGLTCGLYGRVDLLLLDEFLSQEVGDVTVVGYIWKKVDAHACMVCADGCIHERSRKRPRDLNSRRVDRRRRDR
jgi:hypothetical protein